MVDKSMEKEAIKEKLSFSKLSAFIRLIMFSYMTTYDLINKVSVLNKNSRMLLLNKGGTSSKRFNFPER